MYALELAARLPDLIERVITLGSPIRSVEDSSHTFVLAAAKIVSIFRGTDHGCVTPSGACITNLVERHPGEVPITAE